MRYLGGKSKIAKRLADVISKNVRRTTVIEPFCGSGAMTKELAARFDKILAYDAHEDLILMWKALKAGWTPPSNVDLTLYDSLRNEAASPLRGFVGFGCSWGGKWFGGLARGDDRNYASEAKRSLLRYLECMKNVTFERKSYLEIESPKDCVVYADPPYANSTGYAEGTFDSSRFWETMRSWSKENDVFVSEYSAPEGWTPIWSCTRTRDMRSDLITSEKVTEKLFTISRG